MSEQPAGLIPGNTITAQVDGKETKGTGGGVFGRWPGATPRYAKNTGGVNDDFKNSMARMYLWLDDNQRKKLTAMTSGDARLTGLIGKLAAAARDGVGGYIEFLLQNANHAFREKLEIIDTLADKYSAYAFGQAPPEFTYSAVLLNSMQDDQAKNMFRLYRSVLRAIQTAHLKADVHLQYDGMIVSGVLTTFQWQLQAQDESYCPGGFTMLVRRITLLPTGSTDIYDGTGGVVTTAAASTGVLNGLRVTATAGAATRPVTLTPVPQVAPNASSAPAASANAGATAATPPAPAAKAPDAGGVCSANKSCAPPPDQAMSSEPP